MAQKILVVDDNPGITSILTMILEMEGFIVHTASSGEECLAMVSRDKYDLVLLDIVMSPVDGWTVLERIRRDRKNDPVRILMVSAKPPTQEEAEKYAPLIDGYIRKPFDLAVLKRTVSDLLSDRKRIDTIVDRAARKKEVRSFLEEYCRLARIVRAQAAFSALLAQEGGAGKETPTPEALRLEELKNIIRQVSGMSETGT
jgi:DNA-binding response OmpR family regulator